MLPQSDVTCLAERGIDYNVSVEANMTCVVLPRYRLPTGYDPQEADLLLRLNPGFPDVQPDMWWFFPAVRLRDGPSGLIDVGFFTHRDDAQGFLDRARRMNCCVCMAQQYADWLRGQGVKDVVHIPMGFDAYRYRPSLVLGIVGRLDTPRKGRLLVERVRALPFVEVVATEGRVPEGQLRDVYQRIDYVLIPATVEGGPMSLLEGLGMGKPVIAPEGVGLVTEFSGVGHIRRYPVGDPAALVALVTVCYEEKQTRAAAVRDRTWDAWAEAHHRLFMRLLRERGVAVPQPGRGFRFGMMADLLIPATADVGPLEAAVDRAAAQLFHGRSAVARRALVETASQYPCLNRLIDTIPFE